MYDKIHHKLKKKKLYLRSLTPYTSFASFVLWYVSLCLHNSLRMPWKGKVKVKLFSRVRLCDPVDCSPSDSSVHRILQARILEWVAISFSRGSSQPRGRYLSSTPSNFLSCPALNTPWTVEKFYLKSNLSDFFWSFSPGNRGGNFI